VQYKIIHVFVEEVDGLKVIRHGQIMDPAQDTAEIIEARLICHYMHSETREFFWVERKDGIPLNAYAKMRERAQNGNWTGDKIFVFPVEDALALVRSTIVHLNSR
jgi:hypothetical protein